MKEELKEQKMCPDCGSTNLRYNKETDQMVCNDCGSIFAELDPSTEKKFEKTHGL